jgi:hypothetical protein
MRSGQDEKNLKTPAGRKKETKREAFRRTSDLQLRGCTMGDTRGYELESFSSCTIYVFIVIGTCV